MHCIYKHRQQTIIYVDAMNNMAKSSAFNVYCYIMRQRGYDVKQGVSNLTDKQTVNRNSEAV